MAKNMYRHYSVLLSNTGIDQPQSCILQVHARLQQRLSNQELRRRAADLFNAGHFDKALPLFQRLRE